MALGLLGLVLAIFGSVMVVTGQFTLGLICIGAAMFFAFAGEIKSRRRRDKS